MNEQLKQHEDEIEKDEFRIMAHSLLDIREKKKKDYGNSWKLLGLMGIIYQIVGKSIRIWNLRNKEPQNESLQDSFKDIALYSLMALVLIDRNETEPKL